MTVFKLTEKKKNWVKNRKVVLRGTALAYNAASQIKYKRAVEKVVREMTKDVKNKVIALFKKNKNENFFKLRKERFAQDANITDESKKLMEILIVKFRGLFNKAAVSLNDFFLKSTKKSSKIALSESLKKLSGGLSLKTGAVPEGMEEIIQASLNENASLIKSIPEKYLTDISTAVMRSITTGEGLKDLVPQIEKYDGITKRRAKNIALDQTRKAYNSINKERMVALGIKKFEWLHSGGGQHPRPEHVKMSGKIYSFAKPPIIDSKTGERGFPGQLPNCMCTMIPVVDFDD